MERSQNDSQALVSLMSVRCVLLLVCALISGALNAQGRYDRRGIWGEVGFEPGSVTNTALYKGLHHGEDTFASLYATVGLHLPRLDGLQVGVGVYRMAYSNPESLGLHGWHLELKYRPLSSLRGLQLSTRLSTLTDSFGRNSSNETFYPKFLGSLAVGWELPHLLGRVGVAPSLGYSYTSFGYRYPVGHADSSVYERSSSSQGAFFLRIAILFN